MGKTVYVNARTPQGVETLDQFTQGVDAPQGVREFRHYVEDMVASYCLSGTAAYKSRRCTKEWREASKPR